MILKLNYLAIWLAVSFIYDDLHHGLVRLFSYQYLECHYPTSKEATCLVAHKH
jgi:hypothetical protein